MNLVKLTLRGVLIALGGNVSRGAVNQGHVTQRHPSKAINRDWIAP